MKSHKSDIVRRILDLIEKNGITQYRLAKEIGVLNATLNKTLKSDNAFSSSKTLLKIAQYFNVDIEYLISGYYDKNEIIEKCYNKVDELKKENKELRQKIEDIENSLIALIERKESVAKKKSQKLLHPQSLRK